jgi:hypothetical protein
MPFLSTDTPEFATNRAAALDTLRALTPAWMDAPARRQQTLLWDFDGGEAAGWAFRAGRWYRNALDILYTPRSVNRRIHHEWTQGSAFHFREGYTTGSMCWELELGGRRGQAVVQVLEARPAAPAAVTVHRWARKPGEAEAARLVTEAEESGCRYEWRHERGQKEPHCLYVLQPRNIGVVRLQVHIGTAAGWPIVGQLVMSQDDLVEVLIRGLDDTHIAALAESGHA